MPIPKTTVKKTQMEIQNILLEVPKHTHVYVFGSVLVSNIPNDLDILILYEAEVYPKATIYSQCELFVTKLFHLFQLEIDVTFLSYAEAEQVSFIGKVGAIPLEYLLLELF